MTRTAIVAHDAGGAEILSSWLRRQGDGHSPLLVLDGPARRVFERKLGNVRTLPLGLALDRADRVLTGTGWQSTLELDAISQARTCGLRSVAYIDHWVNYRERFVRGDRIEWPDELWVGDSVALALARQLLPELPVQLVDNPYFADLRDELAILPARCRASGEPLSLLYVCEPIAAHAASQFGDSRHWGYTEHDALHFFLGQLHRLGRPVARIVIRRHPSEPAHKYRDAQSRSSLPLQFGGELPLIVEVAASDCVVGCNSMAMVIGLLAGKRVISAIPPGGGACQLPQPKIELLRELPSMADRIGAEPA